MSYIQQGGAAGGSGTVTSVGQTINSGASSGIFTVTGSPVTTTGTLDIATAGTSGGVVYFSSATVPSSSAALTSNALVLGGGAGAAPKVVAGLTTDGTAGINLGATGVGGTLTIFGGTSGSNTLTAPGNGTQLNLSATVINASGSSGTFGSTNASTLSSTNGTTTIKGGQGPTINTAQVDFLPVSSNTGTSGTQVGTQARGTFAPASGTSNFHALISNPTINQTGGANGTVRVLASYPVNTALVGTEYLLALGTSSATGPTGTLTDLFLVNSAGLTKNYAGIATVSQGQPAEYATVDLTAQTAAITATTLYAVPAAGQGMYRISWSATITTAASVSSVLGGTNGFQILYTSPTDSVVKTTVSGNSVTSAANTTATAVGGVEIVYAKLSTNIQYQYDYTSSGTAMAYELHLKIEAL